ncbi:MAG: 8-oxoguanine deaminase [Candidatus Sumerlaeia bacterium]|nr:8-oxoguanine deaminase [Candidatus Sumerlaeia bacterium]
MDEPQGHEPQLLIERCRLVACFDDARRELEHTDLLLRGGRIARIGTNLRDSERLAADIPCLDGRGMLALPGLVNCHHHMFQVLTRVWPRVQDAGLFEWLVEQYEVWTGLTGKDALRAATQIAMAELLLTGCTTTTDHHYLFPVAAPVDLIDEQLATAREMGIRFYPTRGSMTLGVRDGGLPPMALVEADERVLTDYERLVAAYHDPSPQAMTRIAFAPCSPFNVTEHLFRETAVLARKHGVRLHTHLAETDDEDRYCLERYGCRPLDFVAKLGWEGSDIWFAHCVKLNENEMERCARLGMAVAHCPSSNARLGSGTAPVPAMLAAGMTVGLGVDCSASNDSGDMVGEARQALMAHRAVGGPAAVTARQVLELATRGGAAVLGNPALGRLQEGGPADVVLFDMDQVGYAGGASLDPLAALVLCGIGHRVAWSIVAGRIVVERGQLAGRSEKALVAACNRATEQLFEAARAGGRLRGA